jgi:NAD(P)-dependent dehydrogenase (short-subunit alcohol dehydrogenase family)
MGILTGHRALVTGSTQGVGLAIAKALVEAGSSVVLHGLKRDAAAARRR